MIATGDACEGFYFVYFVPGPDGTPKRARSNKEFRQAEDEILRRFSDYLKNRPDLLRKLSCLENGLEVHLYQGKNFKDFELELYFYGRVTEDGDSMVMELSVDEVLCGGCDDHEVIDVVAHEMIHILDFLDEKEGVLPGWKQSVIETFEKARDQEKDRIREHQSPLPGYALVEDAEFIAVLAEVYFVRPDELRQSNPELYTLMEGYFKYHGG